MLLIQGFIIGFSIAAPVGPIGVLCIRRSMRSGWLAGFISGLGAATADMVYGSVAAFGLNAVSELMIREQNWLRGFGGTFLIYLGLRTFLAQPSEGKDAAEGSGLLGAYGTTFLLTLTNPITIISFAAIFASLSPINKELTLQAPLFIIAGVFLGSSAWWLILSVGTGMLRHRLSQQTSQWIQRVSGATILIFGVGALISLFTG